MNPACVAWTLGIGSGKCSLKTASTPSQKTEGWVSGQRCNQKRLSRIDTNTTLTTTTNKTTTSTPKPEDLTVVIAASAAGGGVLLLAAVAAAFCCCCRKKEAPIQREATVQETWKAGQGMARRKASCKDGDDTYDDFYETKKPFEPMRNKNEKMEKEDSTESTAGDEDGNYTAGYEAGEYIEV